jgi:hypothetical protein
MSAARLIAVAPSMARLLVGQVESRMGAVAGGNAPFPIPLIEPDVRISRIRLAGCSFP